MKSSNSKNGAAAVVILPPLHPWKGLKWALAGKGQNKDALARAGNGEEHESVITYSVIYFFFDVFVTSIIQYHKKNQVQNLAPAGDRTRDLRVWLRNQGSDFSRTRSAFSTGSY